MLEARLLHQRGRPEEAERRLLAVLADQPHMLEAWYYLGEVRAHWSSLLARPVFEADAALRHALSRTPTQVGMAIHLARLAALRGDRAELDSLAAAVLRAEPAADQAREMRALRAVAHDDAETLRGIASDLRTGHDATALALAQSVAAHAGDAAAASLLSAALIFPEHARWARAQGELLAARLAAAEGRWAIATARLDAARDVGPGALLEYRAFFATLPFAPTARGELTRLRAALERAPTGAVASDVSRYRWPFDSLTAGRRLYLLAVLDLRLGDSVSADARAAQLEHLQGVSALDAAYARELALPVRSAIALTRGDPAAALTALGPPTIGIDSAYPSSHSYPHAQARWLRAEALRALGRVPDAIRVYASFPDPESYDLPYLAPALRRRADLLRTLGDRAGAAALDARAARLCQQPDPGTRLPP
ncbi:MAG: hypothetical protein ABIT20_04710 [Gemmatimonadaceae bacterium]